MLKKLILSAAALFLAGCSSDTEPEAIPAEFAGAHYEISDADAERWALAGNQVEQCVYPNLTRIQQQHFTKEDSYIYSQYVFFYPLEDIIGAENVKIIQDDQKSMDYASYQYKKFKGKKISDPMDKKQCETLRTKARDDLAVVKGEYKSAMVEDNKPADSDKAKKSGSSTEENRLFFDVIKWGVALMF